MYTGITGRWLQRLNKFVKENPCYCMIVFVTLYTDREKKWYVDILTVTFD